MKIRNFFVIFLLIFTLSCTQTYDPLSGKKVFTLISTKQEIELGQMYVPLAINSNEGQYPDLEVRRYIEKIGNRIAKVTPRKLPYKFFIVNSGEVNAFALPGGGIFVNRGLILVLNNEGELAGVIGHELGHVNARHHVKFLEKQYGINLILSIISIFVANKDYGDLVLNIGKIGANLLTLKYSREQESQADELGVKFAYEAGYDPRGLLETFKIFEKIGKVHAPEWLLTHPLPKNRYKHVLELIKKYDLNKPLIKDTSEFHKIKNKILKTKKSYDLLKKAEKEIQEKNLYGALTILNESIKIYPRNNAALTIRSIVYADLEKFKKSLKDAEKAIKIDNLYFLPKLVSGFDLLKLKKYKKSIKILEKAKRLIPSFPDTYYFLGLDYENIGDIQKAVQNYRTALKLTDGKRGWENDAKRRLERLTGIYY
jgi:predicted Zn-dependent protease